MLPLGQAYDTPAAASPRRSLAGTPDPAGPDGASTPAETKRLLRTWLREQRDLTPVARRQTGDAARTRLLLAELDRRPGGMPRCVACYLSVAPEPDTLTLVETLHSAGVQVLVPLLRGHREPTFGRFSGSAHLRAGLWGIPEPQDAEPVGLDAADVVLSSALAGAPDGVRLGVGGGWYDRVLPRRRPGVPVWALLHEGEALSGLPVDPHDQRVQALVTPSRFITCG